MDRWQDPWEAQRDILGGLGVGVFPRVQPRSTASPGCFLTWERAVQAQGQWTKGRPRLLEEEQRWGSQLPLGDAVSTSPPCSGTGAACDRDPLPQCLLGSKPPQELGSNIAWGLRAEG